jgi:hypothetical protein
MSTTTLLRRGAAGALVALTLAGATVTTSTPASAGWNGRYGWGVAAGVAGGLALGALAAQARPAYPAYYYDEPVYGPPCYTVRQRVWTNYGWRMVRRTVCE